MARSLRYQYKNLRRDPMLTDVVWHIKESGYTLTFIANKCGVTQTTLRNWMSGKTRRPQHVTMEFVLRACGYETSIVRSNADVHRKPAFRVVGSSK